MFDTERTFGVEIEFFGTTANAVVDAFNSANVPLSNEVSNYNHRNSFSSWKLMTDGSVTGTGTGQGKGLELVSPILKGEDGLNQIKKVSAILKSLNAKVDKTCGLHVHHNAKDFTASTWITLIGIYIKFQRVIDGLVSKSRRSTECNRFCAPMSAWFENGQSAEDFVNHYRSSNQLFHNLTRRNDRNYRDARYHVINLCAFDRHGTIEFRQHNGTIEADKIIAWVVFTQLFINKAIRGRVQMKGESNWNSMWATLCSGSKDSHTRSAYSFLQKRLEKFNKVEA